jgi:hypothetical protein
MGVVNNTRSGNKNNKRNGVGATSGFQSNEQFLEKPLKSASFWDTYFLLVGNTVIIMQEEGDSIKSMHVEVENFNLSGNEKTSSSFIIGQFNLTGAQTLKELVTSCHHAYHVINYDHCIAEFIH